ncbi:MAG: GNAT family N-acetyltransferase [candidate division WS1 bacterium]|nr:GNAT family N-acetyltransferase [candidate division WS1 bacterium]
MDRRTGRDLSAEAPVEASPYEPRALHTRDGAAVVLRPMRAADAGPLSDFYRGLDAYTDRMFFVLSDFGPNVTAEMADLQAAGEELHWLLEAPDGEVIGHLSLQPFPGITPRLGICVLQGWQGRGLGRQMMDLAIAGVWDLPDSTGLWLSVLEENRGARALYDSLGFRRVRDRMVRRRYSRYRQNRGMFKLVDMVLSFPMNR